MAGNYGMEGEPEMDQFSSNKVVISNPEFQHMQLPKILLQMFSGKHMLKIQP